MSEPEYAIGRLKGDLVLVFWRDGKRHRYALRTTDKVRAEAAARALYADLTRPKGSTIEVLWQAYCADRAGRAVIGTMIHTWKALKGVFGHLDARDISREHCRAHVAARRSSGIKDGTIHTELGHLRMVLLWAKDGKLIAEAPHIERPAKPAPRDRHLTREEARALISHATMPHLRLFVILMLTTAARPGALLGLTWERCDFERDKIDLRDPEMTSPHKGRAVTPMNRTAKAALLDMRQGALSPFVVEWAGNRVGSVKKGLAASARAAGLADVSPHVLRHTAAVHMAEDGVPMEEIAQYLGHRDVAVTRRVYARFSPNHLRQAAQSLEYDDLGEIHRRKAK